MKENTIVTSVRLNKELYDLAKQQPNFNLSKFINECMASRFLDKKALNLIEKDLKKTLLFIKEMKSKCSTNIYTTGANLDKMPTRLKKFWKDTIEILQNDPTYFDGRYKYFVTQFERHTTKQQFVKMYDFMREQLEAEA